MAQISTEHIPFLGSAFVGTVAVLLLGIGLLNYLADR